MLDYDVDEFDSYIRLAIHAHSGPALTTGMEWITVLGSTLFLSIASILVAAAFVRQGRRNDATILAITMLGASILNVTLKLLFHRPRPLAFFGLVDPSSYSFPSGHSLLSLCFFGGLAELISKRVQSRFVLTLVWLGAACIVLLVGISRVYLGVHYPSDVVGGYLAGMVWLAGVRVIRHRAS